LLLISCTSPYDFHNHSFLYSSSFSLTYLLSFYLYLLTQSSPSCLQLLSVTASF
jgi:hypothetical protein